MSQRIKYYKNRCDSIKIDIKYKQNRIVLQGGRLFVTKENLDQEI